MLSEIEARELTLARIAPLEPEDAPLALSLGRYAARDVIGHVPLPGFDNSQVDGYAVRSAEAKTGASLKVHLAQQAGEDQHLTLEPGHAIRIFTGAPIPAGADAVIMQEDVTATAEGITLNDSVALGENIRRMGSDLCRGQLILRTGDCVTPALIGVLASQGLDQVSVHRAPRVSILSTGDELVPPGTPLRPGQLYNSNGIMVAALLNQLGISDTTLHHCTDQLDATIDMLRGLLAESDVIIISGGVSVGDHDHIKPALKSLGLAPELWRVKVKPGKPFLFVQQDAPRPVRIFGLPGNPVSAFVTYQLFVRPALRKLLGASAAGQRADIAYATLAVSVTNDGDRPHYLRGKFANGSFSPAGLQQSHALHGLSQCNAMLRVDAGETVGQGTLREIQLV